MTKHKADKIESESEPKFHKKIHRIVEHNRKVLTEHYHLDFEKVAEDSVKYLQEETKQQGNIGVEKIKW